MVFKNKEMMISCCKCTLVIVELYSSVQVSDTTTADLYSTAKYNIIILWRIKFKE